jgi:hypothetical protein
MRMEDIQNYDSTCPNCHALTDADTDVIKEGEYAEVVLNKRASPHLGRMAIIPKRHPNNEYAFPSIDEITEIWSMKNAARDALIRFARETGNKLYSVNGRPSIDLLVRSSSTAHSNLDIIPQYACHAVFRGYISPTYSSTTLMSPEGHEKDFSTQVIVASLPASLTELEMPKKLRTDIVSELKKQLL